MWESIGHGERGPFVEKHFEIGKAHNENERDDAKNQYNVAQLLQLNAAIEKVIIEEIVNIQERMDPKDE